MLCLLFQLYYLDALSFHGGLPVRDKEVYGPLLKNALEGKPKANVRFSEHI